jgi:hypothetical protein
MTANHPRTKRGGAAAWWDCLGAILGLVAYLFVHGGCEIINDSNALPGQQTALLLRFEFPLNWLIFQQQSCKYVVQRQGI